MNKMTRNNRAASAGVPFTWRKLVTAGVIAACAPAVAASALEPPSAAERIEWSIDRDRSMVDAGKVQLRIESVWGERSRSIWSNDRPVADLQGLSVAQLSGPSGPARFSLIKDSGHLDCSGTAGNFTGHGACSFSVDPRFVAYLQQRGIGTPTPHEAF